MRILVPVLAFLLLPACGGSGGGSGGGGSPIETVEPFVRLIEGGNSGLAVTLTGGSSVFVSKSGGGELAFSDPDSGASQSLGTTVVMACVASNGELLWERDPPAGSYSLESLHAAPGGTFWLLGRSPGGLTFEGRMLDSEGFGAMIFAALFDASGNVIDVRVLALGDDLGNAVFTLGADGSSALALTLSGTAVFNPIAADRLQASNTPDDLSVLRYDAAGRILWRRHVQSAGQDVIATAMCLRPDGDLVFHMHYDWNSTTILWITDVTDSPHLDADSALVQLDATGALVHVYESSSADWTVNAIAQHLDGHVLCGAYTGTLVDANGEGNDLKTDEKPGFVMRCGEDGRPEWTVLQDPDGLNDRAAFFSVDTDTAGRILLAGAVEGSVTFQTRTISTGIRSFGPSDNGVVMILGADSSGLWLDTIRATTWSSAGPAAFLPNGDVAITGQVVDSFSIKGQPVDVTFAGDAIFLIRLSLD